MKNIIKSFLALLMVSPLFVGCTQSGSPILAKGISLDITSKSLTLDPDAEEKESFTLTATVTPSNYNHGTITWSGGKVYDDEIVKLTPSEDGKTCKVTANMVNTDGVNVYATIDGDKEYRATCEVKVLKKKIHATAIEFSDTTAKSIKINEVVYLPFTMTPETNDDLVMATCTNKDAISAVPDKENNRIIITGKLPGTTTVTISCWDDDIKKCESQTSVNITVTEPVALNYTLGATAITSVNGLDTALNVKNTFKITPSTDVVLSSTSTMTIKVTPKGQSSVDLDNYSCLVGLMKKGTNNWIFLATSGSEASYSESKEYTLNANQDYYVIIQNNKALASNEYDIHITMPAAK